LLVNVSRAIKCGAKESGASVIAFLEDVVVKRRGGNWGGFGNWRNPLHQRGELPWCENPSRHFGKVDFRRREGQKGKA